MTPVANDDNKTPEAHLAMKARMKGGPRSTITSLGVQSQAWPTPAARDHKGENSEEHATVTGGGRKHMDQLANFVAHSPQAPQTQDGPTSSEKNPGSRQRLNPAFVNWLQGNPFWWTNPEQINCAQQEIKSWRSKLRQRLSSLLGE